MRESFRHSDQNKDIDLIGLGNAIVDIIVKVEDQMDAYNQMSKCQQQANQFGHDIMNVYLDDIPFNPRGWYSDGVNEDKIQYDDNIKIDNLTDETRS